jgi:hypothetical protein
MEADDHWVVYSEVTQGNVFKAEAYTGSLFSST